MIILLNGSINSGKSTIAKLLANHLGHAAIIEIDNLREFIECIPLEKSIPINLTNAVSVAKNFIKNNLNIIIPYPLSSQNYNFLVHKLKKYDRIYTFTLSPKLEVALINRGTRKLNEQEKERIKYHYNHNINNPNFGTIIDNSEITPEETTKLILKSLQRYEKEN